MNTQKQVEYRLPDLQYAYTALEPAYSAELLEIHHRGHHRAYVEGANATVQRINAAAGAGDFANINALQRDLAFHVSGHSLHSLFWECMAPAGAAAPTGVLADAIGRDFGGLDEFRSLFMSAGGALQGSGWVALSFDASSGALRVEQRLDHQDNAIAGSTPLLVMDMWEHAFYLQYRNDKKSWMKAFFGLIDWAGVAHRYQACACP